MMKSLRRRFNNRIKACFWCPRPPSIHVYVYVPDDILVHILLKVSADDLMVCKKVCRRWRKLISSTSFVNLHAKNVPRVDEVESLVIRSSYSGYSTVQILDYNGSHKNRASKKSCPNIYCSTAITNSCGGLLATSAYYDLTILNPRVGVVRKIYNYPVRIYRSIVQLCGIYFDRFRDEYKLLSIARHEGDNHMDQYFFFSLSRNVWERHYQTSSGTDNFRTRRNSQAAIVGDVMYWMGDRGYYILGHGRHCSKMVVAFDIEREAFYCLPHPPINQVDNHNNLSCATTQERVRFTHEHMMRLIVKDGQLCFCHTKVEDRSINLWILEDNKNWESWVVKYQIYLIDIHSFFQLDGYSSEDIDRYLGSVNIMCSLESTNEVIFSLKICKRYWDPTLWLHNVETHQTKIFRTSIARQREPSFEYDPEYTVVPYKKTLLSPYFEE